MPNTVTLGDTEHKPLINYERAFGDVHDKCTRNHQRKRLRDLVKDVEQHLQANGPWKYKISRLYDEAEVLAEVDRLVAQRQPRVAA